LTEFCNDQDLKVCAVKLHISSSKFCYTTREACCSEVNLAFAMSTKKQKHTAPYLTEKYVESNYALNVHVVYEAKKLLTIFLCQQDYMWESLKRCTLLNIYLAT
jgi:hypothetical protein